MKLVLIVAVCAGAFFGYRYFFGQSSEPAGVITLGADGQAISGEPVTDYESQQFLVLLASVKDVGTKLREDFVKDEFFLVLKDYTVPVTPKPISRANPFLPIGVGGPYIGSTPASPVESVMTATTTIITTASTTKATTTKTTPAPNETLEGSF